RSAPRSPSDAGSRHGSASRRTRISDFDRPRSTGAARVGRSARDRPGMKEGPPTPMGKTILHADDSPSVRRWVAEQLNDLGVKVVSASDGDSALKLLRESPCDLLLTDLEMP